MDFSTERTSDNDVLTENTAEKKKDTTKFPNLQEFLDVETSDCNELSQVFQSDLSNNFPDDTNKFSDLINHSKEFQNPKEEFYFDGRSDSNEGTMRAVNNSKMEYDIMFQNDSSNDTAETVDGNNATPQEQKENLFNAASVFGSEKEEDEPDAHAQEDAIKATGMVMRGRDEECALLDSQGPFKIEEEKYRQSNGKLKSYPEGYLYDSHIQGDGPRTARSTVNLIWFDSLEDATGFITTSLAEDSDSFIPPKNFCSKEMNGSLSFDPSALSSNSIETNSFELALDASNLALNELFSSPSPDFIEANTVINSTDGFRKSVSPSSPFLGDLFTECSTEVVAVPTRRGSEKVATNNSVNGLGTIVGSLFIHEHNLGGKAEQQSCHQVGLTVRLICKFRDISRDLATMSTEITLLRVRGG